jgi:hypothetical protein
VGISRYVLPVLVVLVVGLAGALGYVMGDSSDTSSDRSGADCPLVQVPVSDHVEAMCVGTAKPLVDFFDTPAPPPGAHADGWISIGELYLDPGTDLGGRVSGRS